MHLFGVALPEVHSYPGGHGTHLILFPPTEVYPEGQVTQVPPEVLADPAEHVDAVVCPKAAV